MSDAKTNHQDVDPLEQLKSILLTEDQSRVKELEQKVEELQSQLSRKEQLIATLEPVLGELLDRKIKHSKDEMAAALSPVMGAAIKRQIRDAKDDVVDALYPILGQMVARSVAEAMKKLVANINASLNKTFSFDLWKKRIKARALGVDAGEVILAGAAPFELQRLFLIAKESGLLMAYLSNPPGQQSDRDAQVIGGMLTAIKSFVETAFAAGAKGTLEEIQHSDRTIRIDPGLHTYLAAVYAGIPPAGFDEMLKECHRDIHKRFHRRLREYQGDNSLLRGVEKTLHKLLKQVAKV